MLLSELVVKLYGDQFTIDEFLDGCTAHLPDLAVAHVNAVLRGFANVVGELKSLNDLQDLTGQELEKKTKRAKNSAPA